MNKLIRALCDGPLRVAVVLAMAGCATLDQAHKGAVDKVGAFPLTARNEVEMLDLAQIVVEHIGQGELTHQPARCQLVPYNAAQARADEESATPGRRLDQALNCFGALAERNPVRAAHARNQIQERMLAASEQRCADYKMYVKRAQSLVSFSTGTLTSVFAAAGAITKSVEGAKTLAGMSGLSSAVGAEYNQAYFANLAAHVVAAGIDLQRARIYEQIFSNGQTQPIEKYTVQAAIRDAFRFHAACSVTAGLNEAQESIRLAENPGLEAAGRVVLRAKHLQDLNAALPSEVNKVMERWKDVLPPDRWLAGVPLVASTTPVVSDAALVANLLAERLVSSAAAPREVKTEVDALTKKKPALMVKGGEAEKFVTAVAAQVTDASQASGAQLTLCKDSSLAVASKVIDLKATRASMQPGSARDKLDIDLRDVKAVQDRQSSAITGLSAVLEECVAKARNAVFTVSQIADDAATEAVKAALARLENPLKACAVAKAQKVGDRCAVNS
jgi:hypothetical protein